MLVMSSRPEEPEQTTPTSIKLATMEDSPATQKEFWNSYLSTGRGGTALFHSIDADDSGTVSASEVALFLDFVNRDGVREEEFERLEQLVSDDEELTLQEFLAWLVAAMLASIRRLRK